jgi:FkbM family methyltransferase
MTIKHRIRTLLWSAGYDFCRFTPRSHPLARRKQLLESYGVDVVLDVGANTGQFAQQLRNELRYANRIISFEPLSAAFDVLKVKAHRDAGWDVLNIALGDVEGKQEINIAGNSASSSFLDMMDSHSDAAPDSKYIGKELIEIKRLDSIFGDLCKPNSRIYMKIDTQGYESRVLGGANKALRHIDTIQMEMSLVSLYRGQLLFDEMCSIMRKQGYALVAIETGFSDPDTGQLLQVDGVFHRL